MIKEEFLSKEVEKILTWVKEYVYNSGAKGVVVGNSGGKDSATVIAIATKALGKENVLTVAMPCLSKGSDLDDAKLVSNAFDVELKTVDLTNTYLELEKNVNNSLVEKMSAEAKINIKPRLRMTTLYAIAQTRNYLVIGTGNLSEAMVGYTTKWGDSSYDFNPIANFTVEEVKQIGAYLGVPEKIIAKSPSDGLSHLTDEEKMGVLYSQIQEFIDTGKTDETAMKKIEELHKKSEHKRSPIPKYPYTRES